MTGQYWAEGRKQSNPTDIRSGVSSFASHPVLSCYLRLYGDRRK